MVRGRSGGFGLVAVIIAIVSMNYEDAGLFWMGYTLTARDTHGEEASDWRIHSRK
jgi:hypothetical protein